MSISRALLLALCFGATPLLADEAKAPEAKPADTAPKKAARKPLLDLNTASAAELEALPGIDAALAQKIIAGRPYKGKDALLRNAILDKDAYAKVRPLVVAHQPKPAAATPAK